MNYYGVEYNLDDPQMKKEIKAFEKKFKRWAKDNTTNSAKTLEKYLEKEGAIKYDLGKDKITIIDIDKYERISGRYEAWQDLKRRREYKRAQEEGSDIMEKRQEQFEKMNSKEVFEGPNAE